VHPGSVDDIAAVQATATKHVNDLSRFRCGPRARSPRRYLAGPWRDGVGIRHS